MSTVFKILLVDDHQFVLDGLKEQLNWARFHGSLCGCVSDGVQALEFLRSCRPDAIISDIRMPHMDGIELARQIDQSPLLSGIPVILLSGYREFEYAKSAMQYHVNHYILKPVTRQKLQALEDILTQLYETREASRRKMEDMTDSNYPLEIAQALQKHDVSAIEDFFQSSLYRGCMEDKSSCDIMGSWLIALLYDYLAKIHFTPQALYISKEHTLKAWYALPNPASKANYLEELYFDILHLLLAQKSDNTSALYRYALQYIDAHYTDPDFSISAMADEMNITLSWLSTLFKQGAGKNLNSYVTEKRLEQACELLRSPQHSIGEIAHLCGYEDAGYFSSLFRRKTGMNPTEYRNCQL
nr:response regulator [uncultured Acetatifactor sp.]